MFKIVLVPNTFRNFGNLTKALDGIGKINEYESTYINRINSNIELPDNGTIMSLDTMIDEEREIVKDGKYAYVATNNSGYDNNTLDGLKSIINKLNKQLDDHTIMMSGFYQLFVKKMYAKII